MQNLHETSDFICIRKMNACNCRSFSQYKKGKNMIIIKIKK